MHHDLTMLETRKLANQFGVALRIKVAENWHNNDITSRDWLYGSMQRDKSLSIRKPETTSLARSTSLNKFNVNKCYLNIAEVLQKYKFEPQRIFSCYESGCSAAKSHQILLQKRE